MTQRLPAAERLRRMRGPRPLPQPAQPLTAPAAAPDDGDQSGLTVVAYFSEGTSYESEAAILRASLDRAGMRYEVQGFRSRGDWYANTAFKAEFIRTMREAVVGPILYVDVDAFVHEPCAGYFLQLASSGYDLGAHYFAGPAKGHNRNDVCACVRGERCSKDHRFLSGTLFFGDTPGARSLLDKWCAFNALFRQEGLTQGGGQKNLWYLTTCMEDLQIARIPGRYCYVFDKGWGYPADEPRIIEHTIASRDNRAPGARPNRARTLRVHELMLKARGP